MSPIIPIPRAVVAAGVVDEYVAAYLAGDLCLPITAQQGIR